MNFALSFISQAAMVLFPALRFAGREQEQIYYQQLRDGLAALIPFEVILYVPHCWLVGLLLSQYYGVLVYLALLFPVCLFEIQANVTVSTFLKVRCEPKQLLLINVEALLLLLRRNALLFWFLVIRVLFSQRLCQV